MTITQKVIALLLVESGREKSSDVTCADIESVLMPDRIRDECPNQKIDGMIRAYFTVKAVPLHHGCYFLIYGIAGDFASFALGLENLKLRIVDAVSSGILDPEKARMALKASADAFLGFEAWEVLVFHGKIDPSFKTGVEDSAVHATYDASIGSLFVPDAPDSKILLDPSRKIKKAM
jgi:hypothetical protein